MVMVTTVNLVGSCVQPLTAAYSLAPDRVALPVQYMGLWVVPTRGSGISLPMFPWLPSGRMAPVVSSSIADSCRIFHRVEDVWLRMCGIVGVHWDLPAHVVEMIPAL